MAKNAKIERSVLQTLLAHFSCSRNKLTGTKLSPPKWLVEAVKRLPVFPTPQVFSKAIGMKVVEDVPHTYCYEARPVLGGEITTATRGLLKGYGAASSLTAAVWSSNSSWRINALKPSEQGRDPAYRKLPNLYSLMMPRSNG